MQDHKMEVEVLAGGREGVEVLDGLFEVIGVDVAGGDDSPGAVFLGGDPLYINEVFTLAHGRV